MFLKEYTALDSENRNRVFIKVQCDHCGNSRTTQKRQLVDYQGLHWCSPQCMSIIKGQAREVTCDHCGSVFIKSLSKIKNSKSGKLFCSRSCKDRAQSYMTEIQPGHYGTGSENYRIKALNNLPNFCNRCGYSLSIKALDVHHRDRDRNNNSIENLEILCCNCHALEHRT